MPLVVKESWPGRPVLGTATYTTGFSLGAAVSAAIAVPLADAFGGWRATLLVFSLFVLVASGAWMAMSGGYRSSEAPATPPRLPLHSRTGWLLVAIFALTELTFFGINAWLPATYTARGWSRTSAGDLITVINGVTIPFSILVALKGDRRGSRRSWLIAGALLQLAGVLGVLLAPAGGWAWAALLGAGNGLLFPSVMMMPLDVADSPADVGAMSALMLCGGFTISATGPFVFGLIRDATGSFTLALVAVAVLTGVVLATLVMTTQKGLRRDPRRRARPLEA
jgi:MFS transporter, CP family, cyanate transporter